MLTPAIIASSVSAFSLTIKSYAFATPRIPLADATTTGFTARGDGGVLSTTEMKVEADSGRVSVTPAAAAPALRNPRREIVMCGCLWERFPASHNVFRECSFPLPMTESFRREHDLLGEREVPGSALYGVQTLRAMENFAISGVELCDFPTLIAAIAAVKEAAAEANRELGLLEPHIADAIVAACREIRAGKHHEHFRVDMIQGGAGTSTNMNANEVIANHALELLRHREPQHTSQSQSIDKRRLPHGGEARAALEHRAAARSDGRARGRVSNEGRRVRTVSQDRPDAAPGRSADDTRSGIHCVRSHDARGR